MERINVIFNPNGTVSFQENRTIEPDMERTSGSMLDRVIVPNVPLIVSMHSVANLNMLNLAHKIVYVVQM